MKKLYIKIFIFTLIFWLFLCPIFHINADDIEWLNITKKLTPEEVEHTNRRIKFLWANPWKFWEYYQNAHDDLTFWERLASWVLQIDDILNYTVFIVSFLSQLWMIVWVIFIMYAWYKYILSVFNWTKAPNSTLKNAIIWVIIVIFSYAIMRILISIIWLA